MTTRAVKVQYGDDYIATYSDRVTPQRIDSNYLTFIVYIPPTHLLEGSHWVTERFLSLPTGHGTVFRQQSLLRQHCIHSVEP